MTPTTAGNITSETAARSALERAAGTTFTDSEWRLNRDRLLNYVQLLRSWDANRTVGTRGGTEADRSTPPGRIVTNKPPTQRAS